MTGKYFHGVDAKGRLTVPSQLRRELGEVCFVVRGPKEYLNVYSTAGWEKFIARFSGMEALADARGLELTGMSLAEQDALYNEAKASMNTD